jgi:hypothetical protein
MPDKCLLLLLDEVRGKTIRILKSIPANYAQWAPPGLQNTTLWHAGHAYVLVETLTMNAVNRPPMIPTGWNKMFSPESRPALVPSDHWPPLAQVIHHLEEQLERHRKLIGDLTEEDLDRPSAGNPKRTVRSAILHSLHDEACHCGEIYLLAKLQAAAKDRH